jgi:hypothetical protein
MEIQDVGLPSWTLQLPNGMILKMGSAQGVLIIPDEAEVTPTQAQEITRLQGLLDFANATIEDMKEERAEVDEATEALQGRLNAAGEYEPTDLREQE